MTTQQKIKSRRRRAQSLDGLNLKLSVPDVPALSEYRLCWITDQDGKTYYKNVHDDYEFVLNRELGNIPIGDKMTDDERAPGAKVCKRVGTTENGAPLIGYLMKKRKEFYEEDQTRKQAKISEDEMQLKNGGDHNIENRHGTLEIERGA